MSEFKGMKGKWHIYHNGQGYNSFSINSKYKVVPIEEMEANALLISKAPEMLEMLKECKLQLEYLNEKFTETGTTNSLLSKIESLIKQATEL